MNVDEQFSQQYHIGQAAAIQTHMIKLEFRQNNFQTPKDQLDYGILNQYKLNDLISRHNESFVEGKLIRIANASNGSIHIDEEFLSLLEQYAKYEIAFFCVYGPAKSGKSFFLDKIVNLCEFEGVYYGEKKQKNTIYLWSIPFTKGNLKIFMIDAQGYEKENISKQQTMLLDFLFFLSSSVLLIFDLNDNQLEQLPIINRILKKTQTHFINESLSNICWPEAVYCISRSPLQNFEPFQALNQLFTTAKIAILPDPMEKKSGLSIQDLKFAQLRKFGKNKKAINDHYIKVTSGITRQVYKSIQSKYCYNLRFTGANLSKLALNASQSINLKDCLRIKKIFSKSMKQLYIEAYNYHTQLYNDYLQSCLISEEPYEIDFLIKTFSKCSDSVLKSYNQLSVDLQLKETYKRKLEKYIEDKQKIVLAINKKKSTHFLRQKYPQIIDPNLVPENISQFIVKIRNTQKNVEQIKIAEVGPKLALGFKKIEMKLDKNKKEDAMNQEIKRIEEKLKQKQIQLSKLAKERQRQQYKKQINKKKLNELTKQEQNIDQVIRQLKMNLKDFRKEVKGKPISQATSDELLAEEKRLKDDIKQKYKIIEQLKSERQTDNREVQEIENKITNHIQKQKQLESVLASNTPKIFSMQTLRSGTVFSSPRKVQSRVFKSQHPNIRIISSPKV